MMKFRSDGLTFEQVHYIRTSDSNSGVLAKELGVSACTITKARHGRTWPEHPTPPKRIKRGGWKMDDSPCEFQPRMVSLIGERWLPVVGWERFYRVSNLGRVYSLHQTGRLVTGMRVRDGYLVLKARDGERKAHLIFHRMVLEAFVGPCPSDKHEGCHNDGNAENNVLGNLRWDSAKGNQADRLRHGTDLRGERCKLAKLTSEAVRQIRTDQGVSDKEWAHRFGVSVGAVKHARLRKTWKNISAPRMERPAAQFQKRRGVKIGTHGGFTIMREMVNGRPTLKYVR